MGADDFFSEAPLASRAAAIEKAVEKLSERSAGLEHFPVIDLAKWANTPPPPRGWLVDQWIPLRNVTLLSGDGGLGKSLLCQQLMTCAAARLPWCGLHLPHTVRSFGFFCEDDEEELHRRQLEICANLGIRLAEVMGNMFMQSRVGLTNILVQYHFKDDVGQITPLYSKLYDFIVDQNIQLLVVDTAADTFGGNENIRPQVRGFINALRRISRATNCAVILTSHPSIQGLATGSGISGSTAWNNTVRSRIYLSKEKRDDDEPPDPDVRILRNMKANYAPIQNTKRLRWLNGAFVPDDQVVGQPAMMNEDKNPVPF